MISWLQKYVTKPFVPDMKKGVKRKRTDGGGAGGAPGTMANYDAGTGHSDDL